MFDGSGIFSYFKADILFETFKTEENNYDILLKFNKENAFSIVVARAQFCLDGSSDIDNMMIIFEDHKHKFDLSIHIKGMENFRLIKSFIDHKIKVLEDYEKEHGKCE